MEDIFFSIIVPCYNVQDYLAECVQSVLAQTYGRYEVLLVDDGATDATPELCDQFGASDERFRVYHKKNGGLSDARNYGMERAEGEYFIFLDSDDFIERNALVRFNAAIRDTHPDVLLTRLTEYYSDDDIVEQDEQMEEYFRDGITAEKAFLWDMTKSKSSWPACKKILAKRFIDKHDLRFLKGYLHEDLEWSSRAMMYAETFAVCAETWYYHRMRREGSITNTISPKRITDVIEMSSMLLNGMDIKTLSDDRRNILINRIMRSIYPQLSFYRKLSSDGKTAVINCCKENRDLFRIAPEKRHRVFSLCAGILGFRTALNLLALIGGVV